MLSVVFRVLNAFLFLAMQGLQRVCISRGIFVSAGAGKQGMLCRLVADDCCPLVKGPKPFFPFCLFRRVRLSLRPGASTPGAASGLDPLL